MAWWGWLLDSVLFGLDSDVYFPLLCGVDGEADLCMRKVCIMFSILTVTATVATCVWISGVASLYCLKRTLALFYGVTSSETPTKTAQKERIGEGKKKPVGDVVPAAKDNKNETTGPKEEIGDSPVKIERIGVSEKVYEEDSDDTVGSYGLLDKYTNKGENENLKYTQQNAPMQFSEAEKLRMDIERSLK